MTGSLEIAQNQITMTGHHMKYNGRSQVHLKSSAGKGGVGHLGLDHKKSP